MKRMNFNVNNFILLVFIVFVFSSCVNMSSMQTARVTKKGGYTFIVGAGEINSNIELKDENDISEYKGYLFEAQCRYGFARNFDLGLKISVIGTTSLDVKYQFLGDNKSVFAAGTGFGVGYTIRFPKTRFLFFTNEYTDYDLFDATFPMYFSVHPYDWLDIYCSPKYIFRSASNKSNEYKGEIFSHWYGLSAGLRYNLNNSHLKSFFKFEPDNEFAVLCEFTYMKTNVFSNSVKQVSIGLSVGF